MSLTLGARLGPYEISAPIGAGGMGEVFRARDTKLNRDVAIKVLPAAFADDPERLARFTREAQTLAALNHPNIATIYGIEEVASSASSAGLLAMTEGAPPSGRVMTTGTGASRALVMELVEGEDLSAHIARGPIPIAEALPIARQITEALEAAHEQGIVHRDLKPANIKVRVDGTVKVLDFGLAKAMDPGGASSSNPNVSHSPTLTHQGTSAGMIIGTAAYMSPEQAKGKTVDKRADIWAFGVVLWEMLTGQRLFRGEDVSDTLAAVLRQDVDFAALPAEAPPSVRRLVARCLDRDLKRRLRDIGEARVLLESPAAPLVSDSPPVAAAPAPRAPLWRRALPWAAAVVFGAALATIPLMSARSKVKPAHDQQIRFSIQTPDTLGNLPAISAAPVISPDGRFIVFPSPPAPDKPPVLWLRPMGALEAQPLPGTEGAELPFWSPDSRHVGFAASGKLKKIDISGGPPQNLCDVVGAFSGGTWNHEGVLVFSEGGRLFRVSDQGGPRSDLGSSEQTGYVFQPTFLPDGRHLIYATLTEGLRVASLDGGPSMQVLDVSSMAAYVSPGFVLYHREGTLFAHAFDAKRLQLAGEAVRVADGVALSQVGLAAFSVSDTGVLVFRTGKVSDSVVELSWTSRTGQATGTVGEPVNYRQIRLSPDEKRVALAMVGVGWRISILDLGSRIASGLALNDDGLSNPSNPVWRPDGRALAFDARGNGKVRFYQQILGARDAAVLFESPDVRQYLSDWSPDGRFLLFQTLRPSRLYAAPLSGDPKPVLLARSQAAIDSPHFSPDGKWVSYNTNESGTWETWVASFPAFDNRQQVSSRGGGQARWRADGKELFYLTPDGQMMSVAIESDPKTGALEFKAPTVLFQSPIARPNMNLDQYDVTRDGQRFIFLKPRIDPNAAGEPLAPITVVVNWQAGLTK